jgi:hypothetical protein
MRTFQRSQVALTRRLRLLKEGVSRNGDWKMNLTTELNATRAEIRTELTEATVCAVSLAKRKLRICQFQTMQILFGGGGCSPEPYENGIKAVLHRAGTHGCESTAPSHDVDSPPARR